MSDIHTDAKAVFWEAIDCKSVEDLERYLDDACKDNSALRSRVEELLRAHHDAGNFLGGQRFETATIPEPISEAPGTVIGPYKLLQQIGEGGMGVVFMAEQTEPIQRKVAIKVIKAGMDSRQVIARFEAERQALAMMDHVNIARVLDGGTIGSPLDPREGSGTPRSDANAASPIDRIGHPLAEREGYVGRPYFVMELVHGVPITKYCDDNHLTPRERLELFVPVCQAIQHAHQKGIIHRDIKPSNVMVTLYDGKPVPKVIDFGVAKATEQKLTERTLFTQYGTMVGTLEYMSPEQAEMSAMGVDTRSDIYSLGVLLYELLTGSTPLTGKRMKEAAYAEILRMIKEEEPPKPSTRLSDSGEALASISANRHTDPVKLTKLLRGELDWIVMKTLEKDRNRRYETANGLAMDVQRYLADEQVLACPPSAGYRLGKLVRRNKGPVLAATVVLLALVGGMIGAIWGLVRAEQARQRESERAEGEQRAKQAAEQEKRIAQAVREFLEDKLLGQADPRSQANALVQRGESSAGAKLNPTVRELLDRAAAELAPDKIEAQFPAQPLVQAEILETIGVTYRKLGELDLAIDHLTRAQQLFQSQLGRDHPDTLDAIQQLARTYRDVGKLPEAIRLLEEVRDKAEKLGPHHPLTMDALHYLGRAYRTADRLTEATRLFEQVRDTQIELLGPDHPSTLSTLQQVALAYREAGRLPEALSLLEELLDRRIEKLGPDHPSTHTTIANLASSYREAGGLPEAIALLERVLKKRIEKFGPDHPATAATQANLALVHRELGRLDEAIRLNEQVRDLRLETFGPDHPSTLLALHNLATLYGDAKRWPEATRIWEQVRDKRVETLGPDHPLTLSTVHNLALAHRETGNLSEAIRLFEEVRDRSAKAIGPGHRETLDSMSQLADTYQAAGRHADALKIREEALPLMKATLGPHDPNTLAIMSNLAGSYHACGRHSDAIHLFEKTLTLMRRHIPDHEFTVICMQNLAHCYAVVGRHAEALELREEMLAQSKARLGPNHTEAVEATNNLAWSLATAADSKARQPVRAVELAKSAVESAPHEGNYWNTLGTAYYRAGDWNAAVAALEKSMQLRNDGDSFDWFFLAMARWQLGNKEEARTWFDQAVQWMEENQPDHDELGRFRAEAAELLSVPDGPQKGVEAKTEEKKSQSR